MHCYHGEDRTGLVVGLHRYTNDHWTAVDAYREMLARGFHPVITILDSYFKKKTHYSDRG